MANYLYNGVRLPALPDEIKAKKYICLYQDPETSSFPNYFWLYGFNEKPETMIKGARPKTYHGMQEEGLCRRAGMYPDGGGWTVAGTSDETGTFYKELSTVKWANYDVLNTDGTVYLAASEPIPVPGDTPTPYALHVPSFLQGVEVGRRLKNKRQPPNPYLFDYYRYIVSLNEEYLADLIKDYSNITNYSWQLDSKVKKVLSVPVSSKPIWSNVDFLDETEEAIFIEGSEPIYVPIKKFSLQEFLEGLIEGMLKQPFPLHRKYHGKFPEIPSQNYNTFPYLTLVKIDDSESAVKIKLKDGSYKTVKAALLASEKPLAVDASNLILKEGCKIEKAYTDYYNFYIKQNEKWFQFYYSTDSTVTNKYNLIWSNYDLFDKNGALFIEGTSTPPHII